MTKIVQLPVFTIKPADQIPRIGVRGLDDYTLTMAVVKFSPKTPIY